MAQSTGAGHTRQDIMDLFQLREALETYAVYELASFITGAQLAEMDRILTQMTATRTSVQNGQGIPDSLAQAHALLDAAFHLVIMRSMGNRRILKVVEDCHMMTRLMGVPKTAAAERSSEWARTAGEHQSILDSLRKKAAVAARESMAQHLRIAREYAMKFYDRLEKQNRAEAMHLPAWPEHVRKAIRDLEKNAPPGEI